ncbi:MAG: glycosyltransferase family 9 protein [Planctomycetota bacterium]
MDLSPRLLLVRLSAIGDVIHTLPALERLRAALPAAELWWVCEAQAAPLLQGHPALDRVVVLERRELGREPGALRRSAAGLAALRGARLDAALDLQGLLRSALVARAAGARRVLGPTWAREGARYLYGERLALPRPAEAHAVERARAGVDLLLEALDATPPAAPLPPARLPAACTAPPDPAWLPAGAGPLLALLPGAGKPANRPPPELLALVADLCQEALPALRVVVLGGAGDRAAAQTLGASCARAQPRSLAGELDLLASARVLAAADAVLGGDTGPLHLARALGRPVVALFNAAEPFRTGPQGLPGAAPVTVLAGEAPCAPCRARRCLRPDGVRICLDALGPERVVATLLPLLSAG